jgi:predicted nuclease with RNAse H fold
MIAELLVHVSKSFTKKKIVDIDAPLKIENGIKWRERF